MRRDHGRARPVAPPLEASRREPGLARPIAEVLRLQSGIGNRAVSGMLSRHAVQTTALDRHGHDDLFGDGTPAHPGMTLADFERSGRRQADWFVAPSLSAADRDDLWGLLRRTTEGPHILAGAGDLHLSELRGLGAADWVKLAAFGRGCDAGPETVRILDPAPYALARRIALGETLVALEAIIPGPVLRLTVAEIQLGDLHDHGLLPLFQGYWAAFAPHLQQQYKVGPGERDPEFQKILDLLSGHGFAPYAPLHGRIRNLHRFPVAMLDRLIANFLDVSRARPVHLILYSGHDESSFEEAVPLFADLVLNSPNLVLMLEGQEHLADITAAIPVIANTYGQLDAGGTPRVAQAMIAGHGEARSIEMAGTGAPQVQDNNVSYPREDMDLDEPARAADTLALLNALTASLDPATAKLVFAGCLVGSNPVPAGTPAADIQAQIHAHPNLQTTTEMFGAAHGLSPGFTMGARASMALGDATSLHDAAGNMTIKYNFDPDVFGTANAYVATGHEPTGEMRAAVEVAATDPVVAANQLRVRLAHGADPGHGWYDESTVAFVRLALQGVPPAGPIDVGKVNDLAAMSDFPFLARWPKSFSITVAQLVGQVNAKAAIAAALYPLLAATPTFTAPPDADAMAMRLLFEQAWIALGEAREAQLLAFLDVTDDAKAQFIHDNLDVNAIAASSAFFFPAAAPATRSRIRLALAWLARDPANPDVRQFLDHEVVVTGGTPGLLDDVKHELDGFSEDQVLSELGRLNPEAAGPGGLPAANAELRHLGDNRALIVNQPYEATVTADALNVRNLPHMGGTVVTVVHAGDVLRVAGFTDHEWAGIDLNGRLGYVHRHFITGPPGPGP